MTAPQDEPEVAEFDLYIEREDLGRGSFTLISKGDPIPAGLASLPRRPVRAAQDAPEAPRKPSRRRRSPS